MMQSYYTAPRLLQLGEGVNPMFTMGSNSALYIQNIALQGLITDNITEISTDNFPQVRVDDGGRFFMGMFSEIKYSHTGVRIENGGRLTMDGNSTIRSNGFNGVYMRGDRSKFVMESTSSVNNTAASRGAGVFVGSSGQMIMNYRSAVTGNTNGFGVVLGYGNFTMNYRSSISRNNTGVHVFGSSSTAVMNNYATIHNNIT